MIESAAVTMLYDEAERLVTFRINLSPDQDAVILPEQTLDKPYGWVFFYDSRRYVSTGDPMQRLVGNAPIIMNRFTGEMRFTGTALPVEHYIEEYEATLPARLLEATPQGRDRQVRPVDLRTFKQTVGEWEDLDGAAFELARSIGLMERTVNFATDAKHVFWSDNPIGNLLYEFIQGLVQAGVLLKREEPDDQVKWNPDFHGTWEK